jgi:ribokinase
VTPRRLVLVGSVLVDMVASLPHLPPRGGDVVASAGPLTAGGGFTVLSAATRLGLPSAYGGAHGTGPLGSVVRSCLGAEGVELLLPARSRGDTGWCAVLVEPDGERTFVTVPGVEAALTAEELRSLPVATSDAVYVSGYDLAYPVNGPLVGAWAAALPPGPLLVVDPGPLAADVAGDRWAAVLARTDVLTLNAREAGLLDPLLHSGRGLSAGALVVRRNGPGAVRLVRDGEVVASARPPVVAPVDSTGAGDVHTGAFLAGLAHGLDAAAALARACAAAAWSVRRVGPGQGPNTAELDSWMRS